MPAARLSALDAAFLSLESEQAPMHVGWAALFAPPSAAARPGFDEIRAHIDGRLHRAPRYRQRLVDVPLGLGDPVWADDEGFDVRRHVLRSSERDFGTLVDDVLSTPLEHDRPLWELWIAEQLDDGLIGVVGKAHHCLVDGLAAVELMALLLDTEPRPAADGAGDGWAPRPRPSAVTLVADAVGEQLEQALELGRAPLRWARAPGRLLDAAAGTARHLARTARPLAPSSHLNGAMSARRHLAMHTRPMDDLKRIRRHFDTTVNDILLSASSGALAALAQERDEPARDVKAMVPVSIEAPDERWGNRIAFIFLRLPCTEPDPVWRLRDLHVAMRERKHDGEPRSADGLLTTVARAPRGVRRLAAKVIASPLLSNLTISNIPGPQMPVYLLGCEVRDAYPVVPLTAGHGISIGMTSVHGRACFGVYAQAELAGDADRLADGIGADIDALLARVPA